MRQYATVDESRWPILLVKFADHEPTPEEFDAYLNQMYSFYERHEVFSCVFDATKSRYLSTECRIKQGNWLKKHADIIKKYQKCLVFVISNPLVRFIMDAILLVSPLPAPYVIVKTVEEGLAEAERRLGLTNK